MSVIALPRVPRAVSVTADAESSARVRRLMIASLPALLLLAALMSGGEVRAADCTGTALAAEDIVLPTVTA